MHFNSICYEKLEKHNKIEKTLTLDKETLIFQRCLIALLGKDRLHYTVLTIQREKEREREPRTKTRFTLGS